VVSDEDRHLSDRALEAERAFVLAFGGYAIQIPGGTLVTNERIPVPRFNFVQDVRVSPERMAGFFERALDHYFQRAIRPSFHVLEPVPDAVHRSLAVLGFTPRETARLVLLTRRGRDDARASAAIEVRLAGSEDRDRVTAFFVGERERDEFRRSLEVVQEHPNPDESLRALLALRDGRPAGAALLHGYRHVYGIHAVATAPEARGRGTATALVDEILRSFVPADAHGVAIWAEHPRLGPRLERLGFREAVRYRVYELRPDAELALPSAPAPGPPRWRPLRRSSPETVLRKDAPDETRRD
jgi:GNAT superfamily N-acetyltransferase